MNWTFEQRVCINWNQWLRRCHRNLFQQRTLFNLYWCT